MRNIELWILFCSFDDYNLNCCPSVTHCLFVYLLMELSIRLKKKVKRIISFSFFCCFSSPNLESQVVIRFIWVGFLFFLILSFIYIFWAILILHVCWREDEKSWIIDLISSYNFGINAELLIFLFFFNWYSTV